MKDMRLSDHFWLREFLRSQTATRLSIDNTPGTQEIENLARLCAQVLEPIRATFGGRVMTITSGFRCPALNKADHGAPHSAHLDGRAADFLVEGMTPHAVCLVMVKLIWPWLDQCIYEGDWTHVAVCPPLGSPRHQFLTAEFTPAATIYSPGIPA